MFVNIQQQNIQAARGPNWVSSHYSCLETLLLDLLLGFLNGLGLVGVLEPTASLAILVGSDFVGADSLVLPVSSAASRLAIGAVDATSCDELLAVTCPDVLGACIVGRDICGDREGH